LPSGWTGGERASLEKTSNLAIKKFSNSIFFFFSLVLLLLKNIFFKISPKIWAKDDEWDGGRRKTRERFKGKEKEKEEDEEEEEENDVPSWRWSVPSKWKAERDDQRHIPRIVDYVKIDRKCNNIRDR